jgi:hypothetical protein
MLRKIVSKRSDFEIILEEHSSFHHGRVLGHPDRPLDARTNHATYHGYRVVETNRFEHSLSKGMQIAIELRERLLIRRIPVLHYPHPSLDLPDLVQGASFHLKKECTGTREKEYSIRLVPSSPVGRDDGVARIKRSLSIRERAKNGGSKPLFCLVSSREVLRNYIHEK